MTREGFQDRGAIASIVDSDYCFLVVFAWRYGNSPRLVWRQAQEELHRDKALLSVVTEELERLQTLWKRVAGGRDMNSQRSKEELQTEIGEVSEQHTPRGGGKREGLGALFPGIVWRCH
jgi:hypothetical protein